MLQFIHVWPRLAAAWRGMARHGPHGHKFYGWAGQGEIRWGEASLVLACQGLL